MRASSAFGALVAITERTKKQLDMHRNIKPRRGSRPCSGQKPIALKSVCVHSAVGAGA